MIHKTAIVDPKAKMSSTVKVGAYSIIGPNVEINDDTTVQSHVSIIGNTKIGKNNTIYSNIHKSNLWSTFTPQIFKMEKLYQSVKACLDEKYDVDDDIEALLLNSLKCSMIMSSPTNIKVTYKSDINYIKKLL